MELLQREVELLDHVHHEVSQQRPAICIEQTADRGKSGVTGVGMQGNGVLGEIRSRLQKAFGDRLSGVVLYGSQARGDADPLSDLDLMVLLDGSVKLGRDLETIIEALYPVQLEIERTIHAMPVSLTALSSPSRLHPGASR